MKRLSRLAERSSLSMIMSVRDSEARADNDRICSIDGSLARGTDSSEELSKRILLPGASTTYTVTKLKKRGLIARESRSGA